jgi:hypothetical protein
MISIAVINESTATNLITATAVQQMIRAFAAQWNQDLNSVWGVGQAQFTFVPQGTTPAAGAWWVVFLDDSDQAGALAYHDLTNEGLPISKVFVKTLSADSASISVGATHEICEMAVDPWLNSAYQDPQGTFWAGEVCDPVESDQYGYQLQGVLVTDFVTPDWFGHQYATTAVDLKGHASKSFAVLAGGYAQKFDPKQGWQQVNGSEAAAVRHVAHAPLGSRRERRARFYKDHKWQRSEHTFRK